MPESKGTGKWVAAGVPHKGWRCAFVDDLGAPDKVCEMCEARDIRYVHYMEHPDYEGFLQVGCLCAGHMSEDYAGTEQRERLAKRISARRAAWAGKLWKTSKSGNHYINTSDGYNAVVYAVGAQWGYRIIRRNAPDSAAQVSVRFFETEAVAKRESLAGIVWVKHLDEQRNAAYWEDLRNRKVFGAAAFQPRKL